MLVEIVAQTIAHSTERTHRFKAILTLNSKLPLCTAKSINADDILIQCFSRLLQ
jgi:hypothetical protein